MTGSGRHYEGKFNAYQRVYVLTAAVEGALSLKYVHLFLRHYQVRFSAESGGGVIKYLRLPMIEEALVPLPPLPEQQRIVDRVDELMTLCDEIEAALSTERRLAGEFAESALATIVG